MIEPGAGQLRIARGGVLAVLCLLLAAAGHAGAGGALPSPTVLLAVGALIGGAFVILADRERGLGAIMLASVGSQVLFHLAFELIGHGIGSTGTGATSAIGAFGAGPTGTLFPPDRMTLAHLGAAAVVAVLARHGDALLWEVTGLLGLTRIPALRVLRVEWTPPRLRLRLLRTWPRSRVEIRIRPRRGPPRCGVPA